MLDPPFGVVAIDNDHITRHIQGFDLVSLRSSQNIQAVPRIRTCLISLTLLPILPKLPHDDQKPKLNLVDYENVYSTSYEDDDEDDDDYDRQDHTTVGRDEY